MKECRFVLMAVVLSAGMAWGQYGYQYMSGGYWFGAQFIGQEGWMVGAGGNILHTTDGGRNWVFPDSIKDSWGGKPEPGLLFGDVTFIDGKKGWACNSPYSRYIWRTTDGGRFWRGYSIDPFGGYTNKITFADSNYGWAAGGINGGYIYFTYDGGRSWRSINFDNNCVWNGISAGSYMVCLAVGSSGWTARTTDGGSSWTKQQVPPLKDLCDVALTDTLFGWACGDSGTIVHTRDGGLTWVPQPSSTNRELLSIIFLDRVKGFSVGDTGTILKTTDGGENWLIIPTGVEACLTAVSFGDSLHGWVIGEGGTMLETTDGGSTWRVLRQGTTERIQAVSFADDQTGWMSTWEGNLWGTQDGGRIWSKQASVSPKRLRGLVMANALTGWAVGDSGLILSTRNGGATWTPQTSGTQRSLWTVFASDAQHAWGCGAGKTVVQTTNGGSTWNSLSVTWPDSGITGLASFDTLYGWALFKDGNVWATTNSGRSWGFRGKTGGMGWRHLSFVDPSWGWAVGDSGIVRSTDGGRTWLAQGPALLMRDVAGGSRMKAWAVGDSGRIMATTDGGMTWFQQSSNIPDSLVSISFADTLNGIVGGGGDLVLATRNGGAIWDTVRVANGGTQDVHLVDSLYGWRIRFYGDIQKTTNGGYTWQTVYYYGAPLTAVHFANRDTGWVAQSNPSGGGKILRTTNSGVTWDDSVWTYSPRDIRLATGEKGWCGDWLSINPPYLTENRLSVTTNRGTTWFPFSNNHVRALNLKAGSESGFGTSYFVGTGYLGLKVSGDLNWEVIPMVPPESLYYYLRETINRTSWGLSFGDANTGWAVGRMGSRLITTDGGLSWKLQRLLDTLGYSSPIDSLLTTVQAFDGLTARANGYLGRSVLTTDGGTTWIREEKGTYEWLLASSFLSPTLGWVGGENGMVMKYGRLPFGVEGEKGETGIPWITTLGQNRPNPFSGETEIRYQLAYKGKVRLVVYNVLGQAVKRLVDREEEPGSYTMRWDGRDEAGRTTSSGVYFYRFEACGQSQTRKMVKVR